MGRTPLPANGTAVATSAARPPIGKARFSPGGGGAGPPFSPGRGGQPGSNTMRQPRPLSAALVLRKVLSECTHNLFMGPVG